MTEKTLFKYLVLTAWLGGPAAGSTFTREKPISPMLAANVKELSADNAAGADSVAGAEANDVLAKARDEATKIVEAAKAEATKIVEAAKTDAAALVEAAKTAPPPPGRR